MEENSKSPTTIKDVLLSSDRNGQASRHSIPSDKLISIEHPFKIQNYSRAIQSLGGPRGVQKAVSEETSNVHEAVLYLHPEQYASNTVVSGNMATNNLLLQVRVPKMIGRKRKRNSSSSQDQIALSEEQNSQMPPTIDSLASKDRLLQSLNDHPNDFAFRAVGLIQRTHRLRTMPDLVYSTQNNMFLEKIRSAIEPAKYETAKKFRMDPSRGSRPLSDLVPPPVFSDHTMPFNYAYRQNAATKSSKSKSSKATSQRHAKPTSSKIIRAPFDCEEIPVEPPPDVAPFDAWEKPFQDLIKHVKFLFEERPIWTRRALSNQLQNDPLVNELKFVYVYVGYEFKSGPWMNTVVGYGIDPRTSCEYRIYQSIAVHLDDPIRGPGPEVPIFKRGGSRIKRTVEKAKALSAAGTSHLFDGETANTADGRSWQVCDITYPVLKIVLETSSLREECHIKSDGWYLNGTWAKARTILKFKIQALVRRESEPTDSEFARIAALPEVFDASTLDQYMLKRSESSHNERILATRVRTAATSTDDSNRAQAVDEMDLDREDVEEGHGESLSTLENRLEADEEVSDRGSGEDDEDVSD